MAARTSPSDAKSTVLLGATMLSRIPTSMAARLAPSRRAFRPVKGVSAAIEFCQWPCAIGQSSRVQLIRRYEFLPLPFDFNSYLAYLVTEQGMWFTHVYPHPLDGELFEEDRGDRLGERFNEFELPIFHDGVERLAYLAVIDHLVRVVVSRRLAAVVETVNIDAQVLTAATLLRRHADRASHYDIVQVHTVHHSFPQRPSALLAAWADLSLVTPPGRQWPMDTSPVSIKCLAKKSIVRPGKLVDGTSLAGEAMRTSPQCRI